MKLSRRVLFVFAMVCTCPAFALAADEAQTAASDEAPPAGALWQIGVNRMAYWGGEDPLINILQVNAADKNWPADVFDHESQTFLKIPEDRPWGFDVGILRAGAKHNTDFYLGDYIIEWDGDGAIGSGLSGGEGPETREGSNRVRESYDARRGGWASAAIRKIGPCSLDRLRDGCGVRNIRIYRAEHEAALKAGKIFNPDYVRRLARYDIVRTMDWNIGSKDRVTRADQIPDMNAQFWGGGIVPIEAQFKLAQEAGVALWINAPGRLGAPDGLNERLAAMSDQKQRKSLIATQFDAVEASQEWDNYAGLIVKAMVATDYPIDRPFYLELANETWNWGGGFGYATEWYWSLTETLRERTGKTYSGNPSRGAYGYLSARLAEAFARALDAAGRADQQWTMVLGAQTAWDAQIIGPLEGVKDYVGSDLAQPMSRYGLAMTGYYRGAFHDTGGGLFGASVKGAAWRAEWLRRLDADPAALAQTLFDYMADPAVRPQNIAWVVAQSKRHEAIADQYGVRYIGQYEGSSHDSLDRELASNPEAVAFYKAWQSGPHHAAIIRLQAEQMSAAFPGVVLSNYQHWANGGVNAQGPWIFNTLWGEETDAERALFEAVD